MRADDTLQVGLLQELSDDNDNVEDIAVPGAKQHADIVECDSDLSEEEILFSDHDSDSEQEGGDLYESEFSDDDDDYEFILGKDQETLWKTTPLEKPSKTQQKNMVQILPGPRNEAKNVSTPLDSFTKFITIDMTDKIVYWTNMYIQTVQGRYARERNCMTTSRCEILALFGILFHIGVKKGNFANLKELWANDGTGMPLLRAAMSYCRFLFLLNCVRFDDRSTRYKRRQTDKLAAIRDTLNLFVSNIKNHYSMSEFVTVDEMLYAFRGRCSWIQYMPKKMAKYGIKMYAMCDAKTLYCGNLEVYCGGQPEGIYNVSNKPTDVLMRMVEPIYNSNRNVTSDTWYTSYDLATSLINKKLTLIGTLRKNTKELPPQLLPNKTKQVGSSAFAYQDDRMLVSYVPKKNCAVILLSTAHDFGEINEQTHKPEIMMDYDSTKGGVDSTDKLCSVFNVGRTTRRWPLHIFFALMNIAGVNARVIYLMAEKRAANYQPRQLQFLKTLGSELMKEHMQARSKIPYLPIDIRAFLQLKYPSPKEEVTQPEEPPLKKRGTCFLCGRQRNSSSSVRCSKCTGFICKGHSKVICDNCSKPVDQEGAKPKTVYKNAHEWTHRVGETLVALVTFGREYARDYTSAPQIIHSH